MIKAPIGMLRREIARVKATGTYQKLILEFLPPKLRARFINAVEGLLFVYHTFE